MKVRSSLLAIAVLGAVAIIGSSFALADSYRFGEACGDANFLCPSDVCVTPTAASCMWGISVPAGGSAKGVTTAPKKQCYVYNNYWCHKGDAGCSFNIYSDVNCQAANLWNVVTINNWKLCVDSANPI